MHVKHVKIWWYFYVLHRWNCKKSIYFTTFRPRRQTLCYLNSSLTSLKYAVPEFIKFHEGGFNFKLFMNFERQTTCKTSDRMWIIFRVNKALDFINLHIIERLSKVRPEKLIRHRKRRYDIFCAWRNELLLKWLWRCFFTQAEFHERWIL